MIILSIVLMSAIASAGLFTAKADEIKIAELIGNRDQW